MLDASHKSMVPLLAPLVNRSGPTRPVRMRTVVRSRSSPIDLIPIAGRAQGILSVDGRHVPRVPPTHPYSPSAHRAAQPHRPERAPPRACRECRRRSRSRCPMPGSLRERWSFGPSLECSQRRRSCSLQRLVSAWALRLGWLEMFDQDGVVLGVNDAGSQFLCSRELAPSEGAVTHEHRGEAGDGPKHANAKLLSPTLQPSPFTLSPVEAGEHDLVADTQCIRLRSHRAGNALSGSRRRMSAPGAPNFVRLLRSQALCRSCAGCSGETDEDQPGLTSTRPADSGGQLRPTSTNQPA